MPRKLSRPARFLFQQIVISVCVTVIVVILTQVILADFKPLRRIEQSLIDHSFRRRGGLDIPLKRSDIIIVEISQATLDALPAKYPWPYSYYARFVGNLKRAGATVIGLDVLFAPGDTAQSVMFRRALSDAGNVVMAGKLREPDRHGLLKTATQNYGNTFVDSTSVVGIVDTPEDDDGVHRRAIPFYYDDNNDKRMPTFSMAVLNIFFRQPSDTTAEIRGPFFEYAGRKIPRFDSTTFLINYYGASKAFRRINFADVIDDSTFQTVDELRHPGEATNTFDDPSYGYLTDGTFRGKIVLVGSTMPEDKDLFPTSFGEGDHEGDNMMYGVEIHANIIQQVIDQNFISREPFWMTTLVVFGLTLSTFVLTAGLKAIRTTYSSVIEILGVAVIIAEVFIIYSLALSLFISKHFLADMISPVTAIMVSYVGSTVYSYVTERKQKVLIKGMFSRYVNPSIVDELVAHPEKLRLGGERKELTVFFSDIEEFTNLSEKIAPESLVSILNEYLSAMTEIILENSGTLDKYVGDAIVAFWGAPIPQSNHAYLACLTAVQMERSLDRLHDRWKREGKPLLKVRVGINTGEAIVGNMGGANRFDYTVIGDHVNLGARLEGVNKQYRTRMIISEHTFREAGDTIVARELDLLVVAGKTEPIRVYELVGLSGDDLPQKKREFLECYREGLSRYRQRKWHEALEYFQKALAIDPEDYPSRLYVDRALMYDAAPPPDDWNGVFILRTK
jgi:adenylate cyclase